LHPIRTSLHPIQTPPTATAPPLSVIVSHFVTANLHWVYLSYWLLVLVLHPWFSIHNDNP